MPPHSSTGASRGSRPWITSQTKLPITPTRRLRVIVTLSVSSFLSEWDESKLTQRLHLERRDGSDHAGREGKRARNNPARLHRRPERAPPHLGAERLKERVSRLRNAARQHHGIRIEDVEQVGHASAQKASRLADDLARDRIAALRRLVHRLHRNPGLIAVHHRVENRFTFIAAQSLASTLGDRRS